LKKLNTYCIALGWGPNGPTGILKSTTGKPEGPYVNPLANDGVATPNRIDAAMFEDDDGTVYYTDGGGGSIRKMKPDLSGFEGTPISITYSDGHARGGPATRARRCSRPMANTTSVPRRPWMAVTAAWMPWRIKSKGHTAV
jgi:beta-xylosidase